MFETLDRLMLAGLGGLSMTRERADQIFDEYVQRGKMEKESRSGFVKELVDATERSRKELEKIVNEQTKKAIDQLDLATKEDVQRIEAKLDQLMTRCDPAE